MSDLEQKRRTSLQVAPPSNTLDQKRMDDLVVATQRFLEFSPPKLGKFDPVWLAHIFQRHIFQMGGEKPPTRDDFEDFDGQIFFHIFSTFWNQKTWSWFWWPLQITNQPPKIKIKIHPPKEFFPPINPPKFQLNKSCHPSLSQISTNQCQTHRYIYLQIYHKKSPMDPWIWICQVKASMSKINEELHRDETSPSLHLGVKSTSVEQTNKTSMCKSRLWWGWNPTQFCGDCNKARNKDPYAHCFKKILKNGRVNHEPVCIAGFFMSSQK